MITLKNGYTEPTTKQLNDYEDRIKEIRLNHFYISADEFDEPAYLTDLIKKRNQRIGSLIHSFSVNSSIMTHTEVEVWKRAFTQVREDMQLHKSIFQFKFPKHFEAVRTEFITR